MSATSAKLKKAAKEMRKIQTKNDRVKCAQVIKAMSGLKTLEQYLQIREK